MLFPINIVFYTGSFVIAPMIRALKTTTHLGLSFFLVGFSKAKQEDGYIFVIKDDVIFYVADLKINRINFAYS